MFLAALIIAVPRYSLDISLRSDLVPTDGNSVYGLEENCIHGSL